MNRILIIQGSGDELVDSLKLADLDALLWITPGRETVTVAKNRCGSTDSFPLADLGDVLRVMLDCDAYGKKK